MSTSRNKPWPFGEQRDQMVDVPNVVS